MIKLARVKAHENKKPFKPVLVVVVVGETLCDAWWNAVTLAPGERLRDVKNRYSMSLYAAAAAAAEAGCRMMKMRLRVMMMMMMMRLVMAAKNSLSAALVNKRSQSVIAFIITSNNTCKKNVFTLFSFVTFF